MPLFRLRNGKMSAALKNLNIRDARNVKQQLPSKKPMAVISSNAYRKNRRRFGARTAISRLPNWPRPAGSVAAVSQIENNKRKPGIDLLVKLARALECDMENII